MPALPNQKGGPPPLPMQKKWRNPSPLGVGKSPPFIDTSGGIGRRNQIAREQMYRYRRSNRWIAIIAAVCRFGDSPYPIGSGSVPALIRYTFPARCDWISPTKCNRILHTLPPKNESAVSAGTHWRRLRFCFCSCASRRLALTPWTMGLYHWWRLSDL